jgi:hypothetical protein
MSDLFDKLAAQEEQFFDNKFLSPVIRGQPIRVRIAGIVLTLKVRPRNFEGWGIFQSRDQKVARFIDRPSMAERARYLALYSKFEMVVCRQDKVYGVLANQSDSRVTIDGVVPILLPEEVRVFDTVDVRWDGTNFWYDSHNTNRSPRFATQLRDLLVEETEPQKVEVAGVTPQELLAYNLAYIQEIESKKDRKEERLKEVLERGGATLRSYVERGSTYSVQYDVRMPNGVVERHNSTVDVETLRVVRSGAGICLSGGDRAFDLQSLVGVIREGHERDLIYRMGGG